MRQRTTTPIHGAEAIDLSILIATYGAPVWEEMAEMRALPSAVAQNPLEVVMEHQPDGNIASARNAAAERAKGEWLCFLDADDELAPGFLDAMALQSDQGLLTPAVQQIRGGRPGKPFFFPECDFTTGNWLIIGTLVPRDLFMAVGGFDEHPHGLEDWVLWAKCVKAGARVVRVPDAIYKAYWNRHSKHHELQRNRREYLRHYEQARASVWG